MYNCRDRTAEYFSTLETLRKQLEPSVTTTAIAATKPQTNSKTRSPLGNEHPSDSRIPSDSNTDTAPLLTSSKQSSSQSQRTAFTEAAAVIHKNIVLVTEKLEKLTALARQRSLFQDSTQEINRLTYVIKVDLETIDADINVLQSLSAPSGNSGNVQAAANSKAIVNNLKSQVAQTTKSFMDVLHIRSQSLKDQQQRRKHFETSAGPVGPGGGPSGSGRGGGGSSQFRNRNRHRKTNTLEQMLQSSAAASASSSNSADSTVHISTEAGSKGKANGDDDLEDVEEGDSASEVALAEEQQQLQYQQDHYLLSRQAAVQQIEQTIVEISQMYKRFLQLLSTQEETLIRIESEVEQSLQHVEDGHNELLTNLDSVSGSKWLVLKIFAFLIAFLIFFIVFIV